MKRWLSLGLLAGLSTAAIGTAQAQSRYYDDGYGRGVGRELRCESRDGRTAWCRVDARGGVRLVRQMSDSACVRGQTWGVRGDALWVTRGCRARFVVGSRAGNGYYGYDDRGGRGYDDRYRQDDRYRDQRYDDRYGNRYDGYDNRYRNDSYGSNGYGRVVRCESYDGRYNFCRTSGYADRAQIRRVLSDANCRLNYSWGYRNGGVWVDNGCRAEFVVY